MKIFSSKIFWCIIAGVLIAMVTIFMLMNKKLAVQNVSHTEDEWCLVHEFDPSGGYFGRNTAGDEEYQVVTSQDGIKVYQKCSKI